MVATVCLDEAAHNAAIMKGLNEMRSEGDVCDFIIKVDGKEYPAHKAVLSSGSDYFKAMLRHDTKESQSGEIEMMDVDSECVKACIDFIYTAKFDIPDGKVCDLLHVSHLLQLNNVSDAIVDILQKSLQIENFFSTWFIAKLYDVKILMAKCKTFKMENLVPISNQPEFQNESKQNVLECVTSNGLSEKDKLIILLNWVSSNLEKKEDLFDVLNLINMKEVPVEYIGDLLKNNPLISNDLKLYKFVNESLVDRVRNINVSSSTDDSCKQSQTASDDKVSACSSTNNKDISTNNNECMGRNEKRSILLFNKDGNCMCMFDPVSEVAKQLPDTRYQHFGDFTAITLDCYLYLLCENRSVHRFNLREKNSEREKMNRMLAGHGSWPPAVAFQGALFVIGSGNSVNQPSSVVEVFNPVIRKWSRLSDKPEAVENFAVVAVNDSIYCIGGETATGATNSFCKFNPLCSEWINLTPMRQPKMFCGTACVEKKILVFGGLAIDDYGLNEVDCYNVETSQWSTLSPMIGMHYPVITHVIGNWIFAIKRTEQSNTIEKYDIINDCWHKVYLRGLSEFLIYDSVSF